MSGTIYNEIMPRVSHFPFMGAWFSGDLDQSGFVDAVETHREELRQSGLTDWWISLLKRFPAGEDASARIMTDAIRLAGFKTGDIPSDGDFAAFKARLDTGFRHLPDRFTSIFPEECKMAFILSHMINPAQVFVAGSYYNYLAVWLVPGLAPGGHMVCSDVDHAVTGLARENMERLGFTEKVTVMCEDAEGILKARREPLDLLVLDAYGSQTNPDPGYRGKAIYLPLFQAARSLLKPGAWVMVHNAERNAPDLKAFFAVLEGAVQFSVFPGTTDNLAVFRMK